jgi:hypothetical protein
MLWTVPPCAGGFLIRPISAVSDSIAAGAFAALASIVGKVDS